MTNAQHAIENAISSMEKGQSMEDWIKSDTNLNQIKSDPEEIWEMAMHILYSWSLI